MEDRPELKITSALLKALEVAPADGAEPAPELVVAASLHRLAVGTGLAPREDLDYSAVLSAGLPAPALRLLEGCVGSGGGSALDDQVRDGLYDALVALSTQDGALRALNRTRPLSGEELLRFAQIYWNLDAQGRRGKLPIGKGYIGGRRGAYIKVNGADEDHAELELKQRADRTPGYTKAAGAFYDRGARLAARVARQLVDGKPISVGRATLRSTRTGRGDEWSVVWPAEPSPARKRAPADGEARSETGEDDSTVGALRQMRQANVADGRIGDAAILSWALIEILRQRSEKNPGDHESQLAGEYLQAGLTCGLAGRLEEALDHFENAEKISQTLSELRPDVSLHRLKLAAARAMRGVWLLQVGRAAEAETALKDAVALSQALTDEDAGNEDLLAASLSALGTLFLQAERTQEALAALSRAAAISQKIVKQRPGKDASRLQFANTLATIGILHLKTDQQARAEEVLLRSVGIAEELTAPGTGGRLARLLLANDRFLLGGVYLSSDRYDQAEESLAAAAVSAKALFDEQLDESTGLLLAGVQVMLGIVCLAADRTEDAATSLAQAVDVSRALVAAAERDRASEAQKARASEPLGGALFLLGMVYLELERDEQAELSLLEAIEAIRRRPHDAADQEVILEVLDLLVGQYQRQGRSADADRLLALRWRLEGQSPDAPTIP